MKKSLAILILITAGLISCKDDPILPLTPDLVASVKAYDLDNNGNSSDIRVDFVIQDNLNVIEYRIMVVPLSFSDSFDQDDAATISEPSYLSVTPQSFKVEHSIKRLPDGMLDVNGAQIQNNIEYVAAVFVFGKDNIQLSGYSGQFTLKNQGIYNGRYFNGFEQICVLSGGGSQPFNRGVSSGDYYIDLVKDSKNEYTGGILCSVCCANPPPIGEGFEPLPCVAVHFGLVRFSVDGTTITNYSLVLNSNAPCEDGVFNTPIVGFCTYYFCRFEQGEGHIIDELTLEMVITNESCEKSCEGTNVFIRQG